MTNVSSILYEDDDTVAIYYLIVTVAPDWIIKNEQFFRYIKIAFVSHAKHVLLQWLNII